MPEFMVFAILANPGEEEADKKAAEPDDSKAEKKDLDFQKLMQDVLEWATDSFKSEQFKTAYTLLPPTDETSIRINFHDTLPPPETSEPRRHGKYMSTDVKSCYIVRFPTLDDAVAWAKSCPVAYDGFTLEIRQLIDPGPPIQEAPEGQRELVGNTVLMSRKRLFEQGKLREDEDGTLWAKVEDEPWVKEVVQEVEKKQAETLS